MNWEKLFKDTKDGKIDWHKNAIRIDNDGGHWFGYDSDWLEEIYGNPNGYSDVVDILKAAGINADWV